MKIYDITLPISRDTPVYPGDPPTTISQVSSIEEGDPFTLSAVSMSAHTGTHVDAPSHLFHDGAPVDQLPLDVLIGDVVMVNLGGPRRITAKTLDAAGVPAEAKRLILKTRPFPAAPEHAPAHLSEDAVRWLVERGIRLIGIDEVSVDAPGSEDLSAHRVLLKAGVVIVEGLDLQQVPPGDYKLVCLPLKVTGCDGAPTRAVLLENT